MKQMLHLLRVPRFKSVHFSIFLQLVLGLNPLSLHQTRADSLNDCGLSAKPTAPPKDLRLPGQSMHGIPFLDQNGYDLCYAYSGVIQAAAWMNLHASPDLSAEERAAFVASPFVQGYEAKSTSAYACNHPCDIIRSVFEYGACRADTVVFAGGGGIRPIDRPEKVLGSCNQWEVPGTSQMLVEQTNLIMDALSKSEMSRIPLIATQENLQKIYGPRTEKSLSETEIQKRILKVGEVFRIKRWPMPSNHPELVLPLIAPRCYNLVESQDSPFQFRGNLDIKRTFGVTTFDEAKAKFPVCASYISHNGYEANPACKGKGYDMIVMSPQDFLNSINKQFDGDKPLPVGIEYCPTFLHSGPDTPTEAESGACRMKGETDNMNDHKSVLIGRRLNPETKKCEFLLRNSLGNECNSYHAHYFEKCHEELKKSGTADVWVEASILVKNLHGIQSLKDKGAGK